MNAYFCNLDEIHEGIDFILKFLDSNKSKKYDVIIYENITERDVFCEGAITKEKLFNLNTKLFKHNKKLYFIFSSVPQKYYDTTYVHSNIEIISNPFYFIHYLVESCGIKIWDYYYNEYNNILNNNKFKSILLTLNRTPQVHRQKMMDYLAKYNLIDKISYSFNLSNSNYFNLYEFKWWTPINNTFSIDNIEIDEEYNCKDILAKNPAFHLITETEISHISFSEKVFKPILSGIPFIVLGSTGFHKKLKEYGFELYEEIFDYEFDNVENLDRRIDLIAKNFKKIENSNYQELILKINNKLKKNRQHALDIFFEKKYISDKAYEIFKIYIKNNKDINPETYNRLETYLY